MAILPPPVSAPRAAIYVRVSSVGQEQDGTSLQTQEERCRAYATEHGYSVDDAYIFREVHTGVELWERPQLTRMREVIRRREVAHVVCHAIDRLARDPVHLGLILTEADHVDVDISFVTEPLDATPEGALVRFVRGYAAKIEHEKIRERMTRGRLARVQSGKPLPGSKVLFGYRWNADHTAYIVDDMEAATVRRVFSLAENGTPLREICRLLTADRIPTSLGRAEWRPEMVRRMLRHPHYTGDAAAHRWRSTREHGYKTMELTSMGEHIALPSGTVPPIISRDSFDAVSSRLERNKAEAPRHNSDPEATLLRGGYIRCGYCHYVVHANRHPRGWRYACPGKVGGCDQQTTIYAAPLDADVWKRIYDTATHPELIAARLVEMQAHDPTEADLAAVDRALADISRRHANGARALLDVDPDTAALLKREMASLADRRRQLDSERDQIIDRQ